MGAETDAPTGGRLPEVRLPEAMALLLGMAGVDRAVLVLAPPAAVAAGGNPVWPWITPLSLVPEPGDPARNLVAWCRQAGLQAGDEGTIPVIATTSAGQVGFDQLIRTAVAMPGGGAASQALPAMGEAMAGIRGGPVDITLDVGPRDPVEMPGLRFATDRFDVEVPGGRKVSLLAVVGALAAQAGGIWRIWSDPSPDLDHPLTVHVAVLAADPPRSTTEAWRTSPWKTGKAPALAAADGPAWVAASILAFGRSMVSDRAEALAALRAPAIQRMLWSDPDPWVAALIPRLVGLQDKDVSAALVAGLVAQPADQRRAAVFDRLPRLDEAGPAGRGVLAAWWASLREDADPGIANTARLVLAATH